MNPKVIKQDARTALGAASFSPGKLALIHGGITILFSLILSAISHLLADSIAIPSGLSGITARAALETAQSVLSFAASVLMPFWSVGFVFAMMQISRKDDATPGSLLEGFRRFGPMLRLFLLLLLTIVCMGVACAYLSSMIFTATPLSNGLEKAMIPYIEAGAETITDEMLTALIPHMGWFFVVLFVVVVALGLPMYYRYRMCIYALFDDAKGARHAIYQSKLLSLHNRMEMFRFDLSFWWYYLGMLLISALAYGDLLLKALKVQMPVSDGVLFWGFLVLSMGLELLFIWRFSPLYQTAYATYYDRIKDRFLTPITPPPSGTDYE